jgi:multiple sugar transport system substrate-binding protein
MERKTLSRRKFLRLSALLGGASVLAACATPTPQVIKETVPVEKVVKETVVSEKVVMQTVPVEKVVKETVVVEKAPPPQPVEIVYVSTGTGIESEATYKPLFDKFKESHPEVSIKYIGIAGQGWGGYFDKLSVMIAGGQPIDTGKIPTEGGRLAAARGLIVPYNEFIDASGGLKDYFDDVSTQLAQTFTYKGRIYGLPYDFAPMVIWFNTKRLQEVGLKLPPREWTFDDFVTYAKALTTKKGDQVTNWGFSFWTSPFGLCPWLLNNGLDGILGGANLDKPLMSDPHFVQVIQLLYDLIYKHGASPRPDAENLGTFQSGAIGMVMQGRWALPDILKENFEDWDIQYWPKGTRQATEVGCGSNMIFAASNHKALVWEWLKFLLSKDSIAYLSTTAAVPPRRSLGYSEALLKWPKGGQGKIWYEVVDRADIPVIPVTAPPDYSEMETILARNLGPILANETPIGDGLSKMQKDMEEMIARRSPAWADLF